VGAIEFGQLISDRMGELELSQNRLASRIGELPDGRIFDATQVRMLREGRRRLDHMLVGRLIEVLGWDQDPEDEAKAWLAAGLAPEGATLEDYRDIVSRRRRRTDRELEAATNPSPAAVLRGPAVQPGDCPEARRAA
jgi:hypothetical protein